MHRQVSLGIYCMISFYNALIVLQTNLHTSTACVDDYIHTYIQYTISHLLSTDTLINTHTFTCTLHAIKTVISLLLNRFNDLSNICRKKKKQKRKKKQAYHSTIGSDNE